MKKLSLIVILTLTFIFVTFCFFSCGDSAKMKKYYSEKDNYIIASGTVAKIKYNKTDDLLVLEFAEDLAPADTFTSRKFVIEGENLLTIKANGFDKKVAVGSFVEFTTVPATFYGYARPIVSLSVKDENLLEFEEGYKSHLEQF